MISFWEKDVEKIEGSIGTLKNEKKVRGREGWVENLFWCFFFGLIFLLFFFLSFENKKEGTSYMHEKA